MRRFGSDRIEAPALHRADLGGQPVNEELRWMFLQSDHLTEIGTLFRVQPNDFAQITGRVRSVREPEGIPVGRDMDQITYFTIVE